MYRRFWRLYTAENRILSFLPVVSGAFLRKKSGKLDFCPQREAKFYGKKQENRITAVVRGKITRGRRLSYVGPVSEVRRPGCGSMSARFRKSEKARKNFRHPRKAFRRSFAFPEASPGRLKKALVTVNSSTASITFHGAGNPVRCSTDSPKVR